MSMVIELIKLDEAKRIHRDDDKTPFKKDERSEPRGSQDQRLNFKNLTKGFIRETERYTPPNAPRSEILMWIRHNGVGIPPAIRLSPTKRGM